MFNQKESLCEDSPRLAEGCKLVRDEAIAFCARGRVLVGIKRHKESSNNGDFEEIEENDG